MTLPEIEAIFDTYIAECLCQGSRVAAEEASDAKRAVRVAVERLVDFINSDYFSSERVNVETYEIE